jgi:hypothetical protein
MLIVANTFPMSVPMAWAPSELDLAMFPPFLELPKMSGIKYFKHLWFSEFTNKQYIVPMLMVANCLFQ